jgi:hypothetical protein
LTVQTFWPPLEVEVALHEPVVEVYVTPLTVQVLVPVEPLVPEVPVVVVVVVLLTPGVPGEVDEQVPLITVPGLPLVLQVALAPVFL